MRREDWPRRLQNFIFARRKMPFAWGTNDCVCLAADWLEEATGQAIARDWHDAASAMRALKERGGMQAAVTEVLGEPIDWRLAQRGDIVMIRVEDRESLSVCTGEYVLVAAEDGALLHRIDDAVAAWRVR